MAKRVVAFVLVAAGALVATHRAQACECLPSLAESAPHDAATVPLNAPALAVAGRLGVPGESGISLVDGAGTTVGFATRVDPLYAGARVIMPSAALTPGAYVLRFPQTADGKSVGTSNFVVAPTTAPMPTSLGPMKIVSRTEKAIVPSFKGGCVEDGPGVTLVIRADITGRGWEPWLPLAHFTTYLDGGEYEPSLSICGARWYDHTLPLFGGVPEALVVKNCPSGKEHHVVKMHVHIAGAVTDPPDELLEIDLECPAPDAGVVGDAGADGADVGGEAGADGAPGSSSSGSGGCDMAGAGAGGGCEPALLAVVAVVFEIRRRRVTRATTPHFRGL